MGGKLGRVTVNQRDMRFAVDLALVGDHAELAVRSGQQRLAYAMQITLMAHAIADKVGDGHHFETVGRTELDKVGYTSHAAVFVHDLADDPSRDHPREPRKIDRRFRLSSSYQHTPFPCAQRKGVPRANQVAWARIWIDRNLDGARTVESRDAGRHAGPRFD